MNVLVDTSVWSLALRRHRPDHATVAAFSQLVRAGNVRIIGPIRQKVLSGIPSAEQFEKLRTRLQAFRDILLAEAHIERAAELHNQCRSHGIQGSHTDFVIGATAQMENLAVFTTDADFERFVKVIALRLHAA